jgi:hypothetical protein
MEVVDHGGGAWRASDQGVTAKMSLDHYVARTYLKRWCDRAKKEPIQAYRKSDLKQFPCWPDSVCAERDGDLNPDYFPDPAMLGQFRSIFEAMSGLSR